jgi:tetratricopeptide (TPR) repeat protein
MVCRSGRPILRLLVALAIVATAVPAFAQGGVLRGVIRDEAGAPVEGATVIITQTGTGRKYEVKTNRNGEYLQVGLSTGAYTVMAEKDKLASSASKASVSARAQATLNLTIGATAASRAADTAEMTKMLTAVFDAGVAAASAGNHEEAIKKFQEAVTLVPGCYDCYNNMGLSYVQMKRYDEAEAAYKKSIEVRPDDPGAYNGLANVYNTQRKFDLAAEASAKATQLSGAGGASAAGGGNADALYNQGVVLWNGGKIPEAKKQFEAAIAANPSHAEAHYQLGMALVNEGNMAGAATEFETYLKLAPSGPNAATAKGLLGQLKP